MVWNRRALSVALAGAGMLAIMAASMTAHEPGAPKAPAKAGKEAAAAPAKDAVKTAASRVSAVTVYANSALVTREVDVPQGKGRLELIVTPLPPQTVNSSLYTEGTTGMRVLSTRYRSRQLMEDTQADVRKLQDERKTLLLEKERLDADIRAIQTNMQLLSKMETFTTGTPAPIAGALNSDAAIAMSKYVMEGRVEKTKELVRLQQLVQVNQGKMDFIVRKTTELTRPGSSRIEQDAVIVVERVDGNAGKVRLNYLVDAASWRPQYKLRATKAAKDPVQLEYLAAVVQQTGESWDNVKLTLSTAQPMLNAAPPDLQVLQVTALPKGHGPQPNLPGLDLQDRARVLRNQAQKDLNDLKSLSAMKLCNAAAALDQSLELLNPNVVTVRKDCAPPNREGPTVTYHLATPITVPSRNDEQIMELTRIELKPDYYFKAMPILTEHVYRLADLINKSNYVLLPGEANMYVDSDFVGRMNLPLVAVGEQFTAGFGVDPQLQVQRHLTESSRSIQGGNQVFRYEYRIRVSSYKAEPARVQLWDRLPHSENENVGVTLLKTAPDLAKDAAYVREQRNNHLLRWDVQVAPTMNGEKSLAITYEFKLELARDMTIGGFLTAAGPRTEAVPALPALSQREAGRLKLFLSKLAPADRALVDSQMFCAIEEESRLGSQGPPIKLMLKGQPVFVCCNGCKSEALANPDQTLAKCRKIVARVTAARSGR